MGGDAVEAPSLRLSAPLPLGLPVCAFVPPMGDGRVSMSRAALILSFLHPLVGFATQPPPDRQTDGVMLMIYLMIALFLVLPFYVAGARW